MNNNEAKMAEALRRMGYVVHRKGWPDFLCVDKHGNRAFALELKCGNDKLSADQKAVHGILIRSGLRVVVVRGEEIDTFRRPGAKAMLTKKGLLGLQQSVERNIETVETIKAWMEGVDKDLAAIAEEFRNAQVILEDSTVPPTPADPVAFMGPPKRKAP